MDIDSTRRYFRGRIKQYDDRKGRGLIWPDKGEGIVGQLLLRRISLRNPNIHLRVNERVLFSTESSDRGLLAIDVHPEIVEYAEPPERTQGSISRLSGDGFSGSIRLANGQHAFFHTSYLSDAESSITLGSKVTCNIVDTVKGTQAQDITIEEAEAVNIVASPTIGSSNELVTVSSQNLLAQAILARDNRKYEEAAKLYEIGLQQAPSVPLILSYASMERMRRRHHDAMRIYEKGIKIFADDTKLRLDGGVLARAMGKYERALTLLSQALDLSRLKSRRPNEKGILQELGRTYYNIDTLSSLQESVKYFEEAQRVFGKGHTQLPSNDLLAMNIARIRTQHHRGNLTVQFLRSIKFEIVRARLLGIKTEGAEFIVRIDDPEFRESYGVAEQMLVRCMFKGNVDLSDLESLDESIKSYDMIDEQVAFIIISSLPDNLQRELSARIEQRKKFALAIVPFQQSEIESSSEPLLMLREVLDRWLYRRDLFAGNVPVVGRRFFGRDKPLAQLRDAIATSTPTGVYGLRKVGKTSLLQECQRRAGEAGDVVIYMDLLSMPAEVVDCRWLYYEINRKLRLEVQKLQLPKLKWRLSGPYEEFLDVPPEFPVATAFDSDLRRLLQALRDEGINPRPKIVLLLDEIERLLPTALGKANFQGSLEFFSYIRGISQESTDFVVIITGANAILTEAAQFEGRDNPVFNFFNDIYLQFLEEEECDLMMRQLGRGMGIRFEVGAIFYIYNLTGGHPFFTKQLCSFIADKYPERPLIINKSMVATLIEHYLAVKSGDFQEIIARLERDYPEELQICVELASAGGSMHMNDIYKKHSQNTYGSTIRHLTGYQIVKVADGKANLTIDLLTRWLLKRYLF